MNFTKYDEVMAFFPFIACFDEFKSLMAERATTRVGMPIAYHTVERLLKEENIINFDDLINTMIIERKLKNVNLTIINECLEQIDLWESRFDDEK